MSEYENFERENIEDDFEYDESAFFYFSLLLLTMIAVPYIYSLAKTLLYGEHKAIIFKSNCQCTHCMALIEIKSKQARTSKFSRATWFRMFVGAALMYVWLINF